MEENLIPMNERTKDEQREIAKKGGIASGKARRRKRTMKEAAKLILNLKPPDECTAFLQQYGIEEKDCTNLMMIMAKAAQMAADGDIKAAEFLRDTVGENPKYQIYQKRLELAVSGKDSIQTIIDDWVNAIPELQE